MSRQATINLNYGGVNVTADIAPDLKAFNWTENASRAADDLSITLKDDTQKWISSWAPTKGDMINPVIIATDWNSIGDYQSLDCGSFMVDEPEYSGPPSELTLKGNTSPLSLDFMETPKSHTWQNATIKQIAQTIANNANMTLFFDSSINPLIPYMEQSQEADASFLDAMCERFGLALKLYNNQIIMFSEMDYEAKSPVATIYRSGSDVPEGVENPLVCTNYNLKTSFFGTGFAGVTVSYNDPNTGTLSKYTFSLPGADNNDILLTKVSKSKKNFRVNETAYNLAEAILMAKAKLRSLNKNEFPASLTLPLNLTLSTTQTVNLVGWGYFDSIYYIDKISRSIGSGSKCGLELHKVLVGY